MPKFLDGYGMQGATQEDLKGSLSIPKDEFGVSVLNIIFSEDDDKMYCLLDAPNKEAIEKHHEKLGYKCEFIREVETAADNVD